MADKKEILEKTGGVVALRDVSFSVNKGEFFVLMGLSASGKSTLDLPPPTIPLVMLVLPPRWPREPAAGSEAHYAAGTGCIPCMRPTTSHITSVTNA